MHPYDSLFFDAFKQLEQLCQQIYGQKHGVTAYIEDMESTLAPIKARIPNWRDDYYNLKRCRHIRNQLAHDATSNLDPLSTSDDLAFVQDFRTRILNRTDPLAQAKVQSQPQPQPQPQQPKIHIQTPDSQPKYTPPPPRPKSHKEKTLDNLAVISGGTIGCILGVAGFLTVCILILFLLGGIGSCIGGSC